MTPGQIIKIHEINSLIVETNKLMLEVLNMSSEPDAGIVTGVQTIIKGTSIVLNRVKELTNG